MLSVSASAAPLGAGTASAAPVATAVGYLALLREEDATLRAHALKQLLACVDTLWHEVAESLADLEAMAEDDTLDQGIRLTAAAVASRVFFHLEEPTQALRLALFAGPTHFDPMDATSPYVQRLVAAALDAFVARRKKEWQDEGDALADVDVSLKKSEADAEALAALPVEPLRAMVDRLLQASCDAGQYAEALGVSLEAREAQRVRDLLASASTRLSAPDAAALLRYGADTAIRRVASKAFRAQVLQVLAECWKSRFDAAAGSTDATGKKLAAYELCEIHQRLGQAAEVAAVLQQLLQGSEDDALMAWQLCFDLVDSGDQAFVASVAQGLAASKTQDDSDATAAARWDQAARVLTGGFSAELTLSFLYKQSKADRLIMETLKKSLEERSSGSRSSVLHTTAVVTHSYLYAGTTNDAFLRDYLDWMKKASNWAKFSATASLGVLHAAHITEAMTLLEPYLPNAPPGVEGGDAAGVVSPVGGYAEGGSLYALGLIHGSNAASDAAKRAEAAHFLRAHLRHSHANEVMSHGAALGVGLTTMGSANLDVIRELKEVLDTDSAVAGEAAGLAIGMVLVGTGAGNIHNNLPPGANAEELAEVVAELKNYARETQHEKIIRGIALGLALMNYGQEENADATIEEMRSDRDPVMRYGAQYTLALAYCGTGSNKAIRILLHTAVSDVSDDVRMAAVIGLAFVLFKTPERVPELVKLLLESFNPHVRYASCMAVGIAMAGTGDSESIAMLEPMLEDMTDYVRQGALLGTAMIYMQQSDSCNGRKIRFFRERLATIVTEKHQSSLTKMGAILASGILEAGGRNCTLALGSRRGFTKMSTAVGLVMWLQHWHWFPMMHMLSMALTPTITIGLNKDFKYPKSFDIICNARPSLFAYPKKLEEKKEEKKKRVETVTLSTTAKEKARLARKRAKMGDGQKDAMDVDKEEVKKEDEDKKDEAAGEAMDVEDKDKSDEDNDKEAAPVKKKREPEPTSFRVGNPARITVAQSHYCVFDLTQRYHPIRPEEKPFGVLVLTDSTPNEEEDVAAVLSPSLEPEGELAPPEPFEWMPPARPAAAEESNEEIKEPAADEGAEKPMEE